MIKAVAFDMDGVLIDSQPLHYEIDIEVLKACGYPATLETVTPYTGISNPDRWPRYKSSLGLMESVDRLIELQTGFQMEIFTRANQGAIDGIPELLQALNDHDIPCAVASSSSHELINLVLEKCKIKRYFTHLVSGEDVKEGKPAPDIYIKTAKVFGLMPEECFAVEDAPLGILAAKNAGFTCIGYVNPNTHGQDFTHADYVVTHFNQCKEIILC
ncbi:MAG: HAD family phosphatase [Defluviitaleaceae bacterium]|nr:HAD family phosphatase [Defluviitaleaceae bacterium]